MNTTPRNFDLVVVGAGPAGSAAAMTARRAGLSTALIDKASFPRDKLCGGLVSGRAQTALKSIFPTPPPRDIYHVGDFGAWHWAGEELASFNTPDDLWFTMRFDFDAALCQAAIAAGAADYTGQRWAELDQAANTLTMENGEVIHFGALIGADGVTSPVATQLFGRAYDPAKIGFALETECPRAPDQALKMVIDFRSANSGYGWLFPKNKTLTVGVGGVHSENPNMRDALMAMLPDGAEAGKIKGAFLPFGDYRRTPGKDNIVLAGDAAGLIDPLTGEGIALALESGAIAAEVVAKSLAAGKPNSIAKTYKRQLKTIHSDIARAVKLRQYAYSSHFEAHFRNRLQHSEGMRNTFFNLLAGKISYHDLGRSLSPIILAKLGKKALGFATRSKKP